MNPKPGSLSGHIFSAWLACPQRAWFDLFGDKKKRLFSPVYLRGMQREGLRHENDCEQRHFPTAERIEDNLAIEQRIEITEKLLRQGTPVILQGAVTGDTGIGIVDVLEHVAPEPTSRFGHQYRVGEIKHAARLQSGHLFQALWYRDLLHEWSGSAAPDVFFIAKNLQRQTIPAALHLQSYQTVLEQLRRIESGRPLSPRLSSQCPTCTWRGICMPNLVQKCDLSLLPRLERTQCAHLYACGIKTWKDFRRNFDKAISVLQLDDYDVECLSLALQRISGAGAVTQELLDWHWIASLQPMAVDIGMANGKTADPNTIPHSLWTQTVGKINVQTRTKDCLVSILSQRNLLVHGEIDYTAIQNLTKHANIRVQQEPVVMSRLIQAYVHEPLLGYDLNCVEAHVHGFPSPDERQLHPEQRLKALACVRDWIAGDQP